ncbi:hypothetical protein PXH78_26995 [Mycolicibacterium smegmatis]|uniref:phage gene 29 protein family protein n=1 Tax=Mycolicibacterium smegmatis TaxID=1772 RepID=UPI0005D767D3|nr:hypothetical protein [Mycolicibacterium smegmatis]MDF1902760.1 hypothetical protein [Mycolicibacterium smegmatis]MDF1909036.1 hypothetical protein [Mycolicibacterium smegmatis]MDF1921255.1 hypothetical protein [Mycolicibacterium smegmatis]MDF1927520.1 hypothetical protein [Mycolicibacterium smegmatis]UAK53375.1 hypothetical protein K8P01_22555 [Mycolicibacterium smegmatis]
MPDAFHQAYLARVYKQMLDDLHYPVSKNGDIMDASAVKAWVCWHLVRCGWRKPNNTDGFALVEDYDDPLIKPRKVYGPGIVEDAVTWVPATDPDDPLQNLESMTVAEIEALPDDLKVEAKRRLGLIPPQPQPSEEGWSVKPFITITEADDVDDDTRWV